MDLDWPDDEMCPYCKRKGVERGARNYNEAFARAHEAEAEVVQLSGVDCWACPASPAEVVQLRARAKTAEADVARLKTLAESLSLRAMSAERAYEGAKKQARAWKKRADDREDYLRALACSLSVGGYNTQAFNLEVFKKKIDDGIDMLVDPWINRASKAELKLAEAENAVKQLQAELATRDR